MTVLQVCAFAAEYPGNFIATLSALESELAGKGVITIYAFPKRASEMAWCKDLCTRAKVYFLPEANARILPDTYKIFRNIYAENHVTIIHSHFELYDMPATLMAPKDSRIFWHLHDPIADGFDKCGLLRKLLTKLQYGWVGKKATLLTVSEKHGEFVASLGFRKSQIVYFPNGIKTDRIKRVSGKLDGEKKTLLLLGWDVYRKGVDILVEAVKMLNRTDYIVRVVGLDKCAEYLQQQQQPMLQFLRPVTDINTLYEGSTAFLHISRAEGQSYALLEAIYAGLPVICSDIPENLFAKRFRNIQWVKTGDKAALAQEIDSLLTSNHSAQNEDVEFNRGIIDEEYSIRAWVQKVVAYYLGNGDK